MAKSKSVIDLRGTFEGITFVKSRTYGDHVRAARGTHKETRINDAFKKESERLQSANVPAKIFKDAVDPYRKNFVDGQLWQRLVSVFRKQIKDYGSFDFADIEPFELHSRYPLERLLTVQPSIAYDKKKNVLRVRIHYDAHPEFPRASRIDGYTFEVVAIFPNLKHKTADTVTVKSGVFKLSGKVPPLLIELAVPPKAKKTVICVKVEGCTGSVIKDTLATTGFRVVGARSI